MLAQICFDLNGFPAIGAFAFLRRNGSGGFATALAFIRFPLERERQFLRTAAFGADEDECFFRFRRGVDAAMVVRKVLFAVFADFGADFDHFAAEGAFLFGDRFGDGFFATGRAGVLLALHDDG